ncbi:hypothetical protein GCM10018783_56260 [Streptomyces griseosporeus]|nr:hypothetical protein GCM10018783_56260 [Streptomyces griseosporeus]
MLDEHLPGGGDDPLPVAQGVGAGPGRLALNGKGGLHGVLLGVVSSGAGYPGTGSPFRADTGLNGERIPGYFPAADFLPVT